MNYVVHTNYICIYIKLNILALSNPKIFCSKFISSVNYQANRHVLHFFFIILIHFKALQRLTFRLLIGIVVVQYVHLYMEQQIGWQMECSGVA